MHEHPYRPDTRHYHRGGLEPHTRHRWHILVDGAAVPTDAARGPAGGYCEYPDGRHAIMSYSPGTVFGEPVQVFRQAYSPDGAWVNSGFTQCVDANTPGHPRYDPQLWQQIWPQLFQDNPTAAERQLLLQEAELQLLLQEWARSEVCHGHGTQSPEATDRNWQRCGPTTGHRCPTEAEFADGEYDGGWVACGDLDPRAGVFSNICRATTGEPLSR